MRKLITFSLLVAVGFFVFGTLLTQQTSGHKSKFFRSGSPIAGKYIVQLNDDYVGKSASAPEVEAEAQFLSSQYGGKINHLYSNALKGYSVTMTQEQAEALSQEDRVVSVEEDSQIFAASTQTNAPWNLDRVDQRNLPLNTNFDYTGSGAGAHIYIIDTGIRITHQEFGGRASVAFDALNDGQNGIDCNGHGTHVAGTAAGATYGVAKSAFVHSVRVLPCTGGGQISDMILAVDWLTANRVNPAVANISITAPGTSPALETSITNSIASGITFTIAAGNAAWLACDYTPARTPNAITVGATDNTDFRPNYSNYGSCVDVFAPGHDILSAGIANDSSTATKNGTSMAAPLVAGVAAVYRAANPGANPGTVAQAINNATTPGLVTNIDSSSPNKLLYSWVTGTPPSTPTPTPTVTPTPTPTVTPTPTPIPASNGKVNVKKRVQTTTGAPSSTMVFPYDATNMATSNFTLVDNQEFSDANVPAGAQTIVVTEEPVAGTQLLGVECIESGGQTVPNTTVDLANRRANILVESGETVTCTFTSQELAPTAGDATISGRVIDSRRRGIRGVRITLLNASTGEVVQALTNNFGYYTFSEIEVSHFYVLSADAPNRYTILDNSRSFRLNEDLADMDFFAERAF